MAVILPFVQKERSESLDCEPTRKSEFCNGESLPVRAAGTILLCLVIPFYVLKICLATNA